MALQNRVTPTGDIVAVSQRGLFTGNRGIIHAPATRTLLAKRWTSRAWLVCTLDWKGVRREVMSTASWTELFFLDEATALAAGHRPCFLCRREAARSFQNRFASSQETPPRAGQMDDVLHRERLDGSDRRLHPLPAGEPPDGTMVLQDDRPHLVVGGAALPWSFDGYGPPATLQRSARLITPPATVEVLRAGYRPELHPSVAR